MFKNPGGARGPQAEPLVPAEAEQLLGLLRKGRGRDLACRELKIGYRRFKRHYDDDAEFRDAVLHAHRCARQELEARGFDLAIAGDADALFKMLARMDRGRQLTLARADARAERASRRQDGKSGGWTTGDLIRLGIKDMPLADMEEFRRIIQKQIDEEPLDEEESRTSERLAGYVLTNLLKAAQKNVPAAF